MSASFFTIGLLPSSLTPASIPLRNRPPQLNFSPVSSHSSMYNDDKQFGYYLKGLIKRYQFKQLQNHQVFNVSGIRFATIMHKIQTCTERGCSCHKKVGRKAQFKGLTALCQTNAPRLEAQVRKVLSISHVFGLHNGNKFSQLPIQQVLQRSHLHFSDTLNCSRGNCATLFSGMLFAFVGRKFM